MYRFPLNKSFCDSDTVLNFNEKKNIFDSLEFVPCMNFSYLEINIFDHANLRHTKK